VSVTTHVIITRSKIAGVSVLDSWLKHHDVHTLICVIPCSVITGHLKILVPIQISKLVFSHPHTKRQDVKLGILCPPCCLWALCSFAFHSSSCPQSTAICKCPMGNSRNEQFLSFKLHTILSSIMNAHTVPLWPVGCESSLEQTGKYENQYLNSRYLGRENA
jgi:hypothetical protein